MKKIFLVVIALVSIATQVKAQFSQVSSADKASGMLDKMEAKGWSEWQSATQYQQACIEASKTPNSPISWLKGGMTYRQYLQALVQGHNDLRTWETAHMSGPWTVEKMNWLLTEAKVDQGNISVFSGKAVNWCYDHANKTWKYSYAEDKNYPKLIYAEMNNGTIISLCKLDCNNIFCTAVEPKKFTRTEVVTVYNTVTDTNYVTIKKEEIVYKEVLTERVQEVYRSCGGCVQQPVYCMPYQQAAQWGLSIALSFDFGGRRYAACNQTPSNTTIINNNYYNNVVNNNINNNTTIIDDHSVVIINPPVQTPVVDHPNTGPSQGDPPPVVDHPNTGSNTNNGDQPNTGQNNGSDLPNTNGNNNGDQPNTGQNPLLGSNQNGARVAETYGTTTSQKNFTTTNKGTNTTQTADLKKSTASEYVAPSAATSYTKPVKTYTAPQKSSTSNYKQSNNYSAPAQNFSKPVKFNTPQKSVQQNYSQPQNRTFQSPQKSFSGPVKKF